MSKLNNIDTGYIFIILIAAVTSALIQGNYLISGIFFLCIAASLFITKCSSIYERVYYTLLVSAVFEYTMFIPGHEKIYFFHIMLAICSLFSLIEIIKDKSIMAKFDKKIICFFISWFFYICLSFFWSKNKSFNIKYIAIYFMMFVFIANIIIFNMKQKNIKNSIKVLGFMFFICVIIGIIESATSMQFPIRHYYNFTVHELSDAEIELIKTRPMVFFYNPNNFATYVAICLPFLFYLICFASKYKNKILFFIWSAVAFASIVLTTSRSILFSVVFMTAVYVIVTFFEGRLKLMMYPIIIILMLVAVYKSSYFIVSRHNNIYMQKMQQKMTNIKNISLNEVGQESSEGERITIIYDVVEGVFKDKHYFGYGAGNTPQLLMDKANTHGIYSPHALAAELLGDFGIFIVLYGAFYIYIICKLLNIAWKREDRFIKITGYSLATALFGFALGSFAPSSVTYFLPYWMLLGISIAFFQYYETCIGNCHELK